MKKTFKTYWPLLLVLAVVGFLFTFRLGRDLLWDWDECIYGQYAKEMLNSRHFFTNIWNGYVDLQKPPLYSWLLNIPALFGRTELNLRFLNVIGSLALISSVYVFSQQYFSRKVAILSSLILLTGEVFVIYTMKINTDILYSLFIFLGAWGWLSSKKRGFWISGLFFGLAIMVKGLGVTQFLGALFISLFINFRKEQLLNFLKLCFITGLIILPWHVSTYVTYGNHFLKVYIQDSIIKRSQYPLEFHRERVWFYFALLYREIFPWLFAFIVFPLIVMLNLFQHHSGKFKIKKFLKLAQDNLKKNELIYTLLLLIVVPLLGITKVQTRIAWYILPIYPFIAIYLAYCLNLLLDLVLEKFPKKHRYLILNTLYVILVTFLALDAGRLIFNETKFFKPQRTMEPRQEVQFAVSKQKEPTLNYLVSFGERQAKEILPKEEQMDMTWVYGGNACMVYYGDKKTNYIYETRAFEQALKVGSGLFLISNQDSKYAEGKKILFRNAEYTLFTF